MKIRLLIIALGSLCSLSHAMSLDGKSVGWLNFQFEQIADGSLIKQASEIHFPEASTEQIWVNNAIMHQTLIVIEIANEIDAAIKKFQSIEAFWFYEERNLLGQLLKNKAAEIIEKISLLKSECNNCGEYNCSECIATHKLEEAISYMKMLAVNIAQYCAYIPYDDGLECAHVSVTTGGAQDAGNFKKVIYNHKVPSQFIAEGFIKEFSLDLKNTSTSKYIDVQSATAFDRERNKLFVQVGILSSIKPEEFKRKPLNLSVVLDISGSMSANDDTLKTRLEWSKLVIRKVLPLLNENDVLSIITFDHNVYTLSEPQKVIDKESIIKLINSIRTGGATNLHAALSQGFQLASQMADKAYENRVLLISDAGANTGETRESAINDLIAKFAAGSIPIGLTAIGIGENFNEPLIHAITMSKGGNYLFVQSGKEMVKFFENFNYLVTPVAYNFKVDLGLSKRFKLANVYGIPKPNGQNFQNIVSVGTLFFTKNAGGAIVLEFDMT